MKKIIAVTAGLMLAGSFVASANAATINFSGDARARYNYQDNYSGIKNFAPKDADQTFWTSRVRLQFKIETKGGAYAVGRFRLADGTWDNADNSKGNSTLASGEKSNLFVDVAYVGLPLQNIPVKVEGGVMYNTVTELLRKDDPFNTIRAVYGNENTTVSAFMEKNDEYFEREREVISTDPVTGLAVSKMVTVVDDDGMSDDDITQYGVNLIQKFGNGWTGNFLLMYRDDQQTRLDSFKNEYDTSGFIGDATLVGKVGEIGLIGEIQYREADANRAYGSTTSDDGVGGFVGVNIPLGIASVSMVGGATFNGFLAGSDFGGDDQMGYVPFVMLSGATTEVLGMMNTGILVGSADGDAYFFNVAPSVRVSDKLTLTAEGTYLSVDVADDSIDIYEIGGIAQYKVTDGATLTALIGYLDIENLDENPLGVGLALDLKF
ncbi:MAG TPA: hypothetical protein DEB25_02410 [Desulfobulbaceae bacterium]|nr:hypothetical protein [Desulfobulbaceae bacterium]